MTMWGVRRLGYHLHVPSSCIPWSVCSQHGPGLRWMCNNKQPEDGSVLSEGSEKNTRSSQNASSPQFNSVHIQMLPPNLHKQIFKDAEHQTKPRQTTFEKVKKHLKEFNLWDKQVTELADVDLELPQLYGNNIDEHFKEIASQQGQPYRELIGKLLSSEVPAKPREWAMQPGWTRYDPETGAASTVEYPEEHVMIFDVEVLMSHGDFPTMATAVTHQAWYSWCSHRVTQLSDDWTEGSPRLSDLIPLESPADQGFTDPTSSPYRLVIGHNVGFDRSFIKEQYYIKGSRLRFLDTMSLHIAIAGLTSLQRTLYRAEKTGNQPKEVREHRRSQAMFGFSTSSRWMEKSSMNNLSDVYQLYCQGEPLDKATRNVFIEGNMDDVRTQFQDLMTYCSKDVEATLDVFKKLWPMFQRRFPHPVTFCGMLEMGTTFLPINSNWQKYIDQSDAKYDTLQESQSQLLRSLAEQTHKMADNQSYKDDPWLWDLDWRTREKKYKNVTKKKSELRPGEPKVSRVPSGTQPHMAGYPNWYRELCATKSELVKGAPTGVTKITTQRRITPKLLRLTWEGYPLHYNSKHGWGYLVPSLYTADPVEEELASQQEGTQQEAEEKKTPKYKKWEALSSEFPFEQLVDIVSRTHPEHLAQLKKKKVPTATLR